MKTKLILIVFVLVIFSLSAVEHPLGLIYEDPRTVPWMKEAESIFTKQPRPDSLDYSDGMPPVGYQYLGSCVAWASGYYYKGYQEYVDHDGWDMTDPRHQFHPKFIYNQINGGKDEGAGFGDGFKCLTDLGVAPMSSLSYADDDSVTWPTEKGYNDAIPFRCEQAYWFNVTNDAGIEALKNHMYNNNDCAVIGINVYGNFDNIGSYNHIYAVSEVYGPNRGGHAICLVGYNDSLPTPDGPGAFRLVNSWGTFWGQQGYAWITYEAVKSSVTCYGYAYYATDKKNYQPTTKVAYKVSHNERLDITVQVSISPYWTSRTFFNWGKSKLAQYPYPDNAIILDITEGDEYLSAYSSNRIILNVRDTDGDGINGEVLDYSGLISGWGFHSPSPDTPKTMLDYGYTSLDLFIPINTYHWQSFHRLADNSGFIDLTSDMVDTSRVIWTFPTHDSIESSPIIADIDGDDILEIVIGSNDDTLYAVNADGSELWSYGMGGKVIGAPAVGDLDEDGKIEVVASSNNNNVVSLNGEDASFNWEYSFINGVPGSPAVSFIDGDRRLEVVGVGFFLRVINGENGSSVWGHFNGTPSRSSPAVGDVYDADGIFDIVVGQGNSVKFYNGKDGSVVGTFITSDAVLSSPAIGDIDGDSLMEVVIGSDDDTLYALELDSLIWKFGTGGDVRSSPALGDIDGDDKLEVVFGSNDGSVYALNAEDGSLYWSYPTGGEVISSPALADLDGNDTVDVVVGSKDGYLYAISGNGSLLWQVDLGTPITSSPALGDIDKDGKLEVAVGGLDGNLYVIDVGVAGIKEETLKERFYLSKIDSPLSNGTIIHYSISEREAVNLSIFDITGREIKNIVNKIQEPGQYSVSVGIEKLPNGIYFYRLTQGNRAISRKMVVVR